MILLGITSKILCLAGFLSFDSYIFLTFSFFSINILINWKKELLNASLISSLLGFLAYADETMPAKSEMWEKEVFLGNEKIHYTILFWIVQWGAVKLFDLKFDIMKLYLIEIGLITWLKLIQEPVTIHEVYYCGSSERRCRAILDWDIYYSMYDLEGQIAKWLAVGIKLPIHLLLIHF